MAFNIMITMGLLVAVVGFSNAGVIAPAAVAAPLVAPAAIGYAKAVPYNVPPFASRVDISTRALAAPYVATAPYVAASPVVAPSAPLVAAPGPFGVSAPIVAAPGYYGATYPGNFASPFAPFAAAAYGPTVLG